MNQRVHIVSLGCPKNLVDSEIMLGTLVKEGWTVTDAPEDADTIVVNTCGFIEDAKKESLDKILEMASLKSDGRKRELVMAGCLTQRYQGDLVESLQEVDLFVGSGEFQNIGTILRNHRAGDTRKDFFHLPTFLQDEGTPRLNSQPGYTAYLKISEGCLKRCAFCSIPKIRGNLQSRTLKAIVAEAKLLAASGVKELNIISHDFTDYGWDLRKKDSEAVESPEALLEALDQVDGLRWIRLLYLYPDGITDRMIEIIRKSKKIVKYFDMPLQHISDRMLKEMNRKMTRPEIEERLDAIRSQIPEATIRTQFIVGFPGETEEDFAELLEFVKTQEFDRVGCFQYSPEDNTPGGRRTDQLDDAVKQKRHDRLMALQMKISRKKHRAFVGKTVQVLVVGESEESELLLQGRMAQQAPEIDGVVYINDGKADVGEIVDVRVTDSHDYDLVGEIVRDYGDQALGADFTLNSTRSPLRGGNSVERLIR